MACETQTVDGMMTDVGHASGAPEYPSLPSRVLVLGDASCEQSMPSLCLARLHSLAQAQHEQAVTRQSSTMFGGVSSRAVDGKPGRFFSDGSTTMTELETEPWWEVSAEGTEAVFPGRVPRRGGDLSKASPCLSTATTMAAPIFTSATSGASYLPFSDRAITAPPHAKPGVPVDWPESREPRSPTEPSPPALERLAPQVELSGAHALGYLRLFGHEKEIARREVQVFSIRSKTSLGGSFTLNVTDDQGVTRTTGGGGRACPRVCNACYERWKGGSSEAAEGRWTHSRPAFPRPWVRATAS